MQLQRVFRHGVLVLVCTNLILICVTRYIYRDEGVDVKENRPRETELYPDQGVDPSTDDSHYLAHGSKSFQRRCLPILNPGVDCSRIIMGDVEYTKSVKKIPQPKISAECSLPVLLEDCETLIDAHGYNDFHVSDHELKWPLAFTLKVHKNPSQILQLFRNIYRAQNVYCIHVDIKSPGCFSVLKKFSRCFKNVHVINERVDVVYKSFRQVESEMLCLRYLAKSEVGWKYYLDMAGEEFPLRTNREIVEIVQHINGTNDIESYRQDDAEYRFKYVHVVVGTEVVTTGITKRPFGHGVGPRKGSAYGLLSREFVNFVLENPLATNFIAWLNDTGNPDESLWSTLVTFPGAPGGYQLEIRHDQDTFMSRAMVWRWDEVKCHGEFHRSVCHFGLADLPWLAQSPRLISNKIDIEKEPLLLNCLEELYRNRSFEYSVTNLNWYYYTNLPHVKARTNH